MSSVPPSALRGVFQYPATPICATDWFSVGVGGILAELMLYDFCGKVCRVCGGTYIS